MSSSTSISPFRLFTTYLGALFLLIFLAPEARAQGSVYGGLLEWRQIGNSPAERSVEVEVTRTLRKGLFPSATVGSTVNTSWTLNYGDGSSSVTAPLVVTSIDPVQDKLVATGIFTHTYADYKSYTISTNSTCCRPSFLTGGNSSASMKMTATVTLEATAFHKSPQFNIQGFLTGTLVYAHSGAPFAFSILAAHAKPVGFRFATGVESALVAPIPTGATLDAGTGLLTMPSQAPGAAHAAQIIAECEQGTASLDLYMEFTPPASQGPAFNLPAGGEVIAYTGLPAEFQVVVSDPTDPVVTLTYGSPTGLTLLSSVTSGPANNIRTLNFRWDPPLDAFADNQMQFMARSSLGETSYATLRLRSQLSQVIALSGLIRDFKASHPDFDLPNADAATRFVQTALPADTHMPQFLAAAGLTSVTAGTFPQWWTSDPTGGYSLQKAQMMILSNGGQPNSRTYKGRLKTYPIDNELFGNEGQPHNGFFTYEANTYIAPHAGDMLSFRSSDDLWVFINNRLVADLGGIHGVESATVDLAGNDLDGQPLNLTEGEFYRMDVFYAHRGQHEPLLEIQIVAGEPAPPCAAEPVLLAPVDPEDFQLVGPATWLNDGTLELVGPGDPANTSSVAWFDTPLPLTEGFSLHFEFEGSAEIPGFALVLADPDTPPTTAGSPGNQLGYGGLPGTLALEFDSIADAALGDPLGPIDQVALHSLGQQPNTAASTAMIDIDSLVNAGSTPISDGAVHRVDISFNFPASPTQSCSVQVFVDLTPPAVSPVAVFTIPREILARVCGDPSGQTFGPLRWGITGSTSPSGTNASSKLRFHNLKTAINRKPTTAQPSPAVKPVLVRGSQQVELFQITDACNFGMLAPGHASSFSATLTREGGGETVPVNVTDLNNGAYSLDYTPTLTGAWSLAVNFENGPAAGSPYALTVISPYAAWANANFDAGTPVAQRDPENDPDGDGLANGLEYVTGGDPDTAGASPFILAETASELVLSYPRKHGVPEGSDPAWISDDLVDWQPATGLQRDVEAIDANTDLIKLHLPLGLGERKFLRVTYAGDGL